MRAAGTGAEDELVELCNVTICQQLAAPSEMDDVRQFGWQTFCMIAEVIKVVRHQDRCIDRKSVV